MSASYGTLILDEADSGGNLIVRGSVTVALSQRVPDAGDDLIFGQAPVSGAFRAGGPPSVRLPFNDTFGPQGDDAPGTTYTITYNGVPGSPAPWSFYLLSTNGATQRLSALASTPAAQPGQQYVPLPDTPPADDTKVLGLSSSSPLVTEWVDGGGGGGGSGTVTSVAVETANGFAGTVANDTTDAQITLKANFTSGIVKAGSGGAISAATAGTDYLAPGALPNGTTATTQTAADDSTKVATTAYTDGAVATETSRAETAEALKLARASNLSDVASQQTALDNLAGAVTANEVLAGNGTHVTLRALAAADLPAATTSAQGAVQLDGTASDLQPAWVAAAGGKGEAADAKHVHPLQPWQFPVEAYGAKGDGKLVTDGTMSNGSAALACTTSTPFTGADVGKPILVWIYSLSEWLFTTITGFTDSGHVTLGATAPAACSNVGVAWGTDNAAAITSAVNAAAAAGGGQVIFRDAIYCVSAAAAKGGSTAGNAQIPLPVVNPLAGTAVRVDLIGVPGPQSIHWTQPQPVQSGTILLGMRQDGANDSTYGPTSVIGGPVDGCGGSGGTFSNMLFGLDGITILTPPAGGTPAPYCGVDLFAVGQCQIGTYAFLPLAVWEVTTQGGTASTVWPDIYANTLAEPSYTFGLRTPTRGNNALVTVGTYTCMLAQYGLVGHAHLQVTELATYYCGNGWVPGVPEHGAHITHWECQNTPNVMSNWPGQYGSGGGDPVPVTVGMADLESYTYVVTDSGGMVGEVYFEDMSSYGNYYGLLNNASSGVPGIRVIATTNGPGPVTAPSVPASGTACGNYFYRDAAVIITGGDVSQIAVDGTALNLTAGLIIVPAGHTVTLTYSSAPSWSWVLL